MVSADMLYFTLYNGKRGTPQDVINLYNNWLQINKSEIDVSQQIITYSKGADTLCITVIFEKRRANGQRSTGNRVFST